MYTHIYTIYTISFRVYIYHHHNVLVVGLISSLIKTVGIHITNGMQYYRNQNHTHSHTEQDLTLTIPACIYICV